MSGRSPALPRPAANNNTNNHLYNAAGGNTGGSNSAAAGGGGGGGLLLDEESIRSAVMSDVMNRRAEIEARIQQQQQQSQSQQQQQSQRPSTTTTTTTKSQTTTTTTKTRMNKNSSAVVLNTTRNQSSFDSLGDDDAGDANSASGVLSHLTDDAQSHASRLSTLSNNVSHILSTAKKILQGENPDDNHVIDEEGGGGMGDDDDDDDEESEYNLNGGEILVPTNTDSMKIRGGRSKSVNVSVKDGNKHDNNKGANTKDNNDDDDDDTEMYDFLLDNTCEMTWGRRLGLALSNKTWYNPSLLHVVIAAAEVAEESNEKGLHDEALVDPNNVSSPVKSLLSKSFSSDEDDEDDISNGLLLGKSKSGSTTNSGSPTATIKRSKKAQAEWTRMQQEQRQKQMERAMLRNEAYPFTHSQKEQPSLAKAWAYFEHVALARYVVPGTSEQEEELRKAKRQQKNILVRCFRRCFCKGDQQLNRAEPGEAFLRTRLYSPIFTPHKQLGDWGLGIGLYFSTLRAVCILTFLAGVLNTQNFIYFSQHYNLDAEATLPTPLLIGSAICTDTTWVPCPDCVNYTNNTEAFDPQRIGVGVRVRNLLDPSNNETLYFAVRNNCDGPTVEQGMVNYATLLFLIVGTFILGVYLRKMAVAFDEDEQTAQDYSIVIANPPGDATDPEEWRQFFYDNFDGAHVTACTIGVDNDLLVKSLVERRELMRQLEMNLEPGTSLDTLSVANVAAQQEHKRRFFGNFMAKLAPGIPEFFSRIVVLTAKVQGLAQQDYPASNVFITFETEAAQRRVLSALSLGSMHVRHNKISALEDPKHLFRGKYVLDIKEPDEPNTVRWQDLNEKFKDRVKQQVFTVACTFGAIIVIAIVVKFCSNVSPLVAAISISVFNAIFPMFAKMLTSCEAHSSEGGKQRSLYLKIAVFRWVNTAVVITIIKPFTLTLAKDDGLIPQIYALFFAEIVTTNLIQLADPMGHIQRHFLATRASTQDAMNLNMRGQEFELAERYTNATKILFLAVWYCSLFPGALFMCSFALFLNYFVDRFSLMRTWKRPPHLGPSISEFSRQYFFPLALVAMSIMSSYYWAGFPFDNLCPVEGTSTPVFNGTWLNDTWIIQPNDGGNVTTEKVESDDQLYSFCRQDFFRYDGFVFPFVSSFQAPGEEWMTPSQEMVTTVFGWTSVAIVAAILLKFAWRMWDSVMSMFRGGYSPSGEDQAINFSKVPTISAYIPQVHSTVFSYPLLACNIDRIDSDLLDWTDPDRPFSFYDLTKDAEVLLRGTDVSSKNVFSQVVHWPPSE